MSHFSALPPQIAELLEKLNAPPRLIAHLRLVHDAAMQLTHELDTTWPTLHYDREIVLLGAATHDIGKIVHPDELAQSGKRHETAGRDLLVMHGFTTEQARFALTHGQWQTSNNLEDLLVALTDKIWKGARVEPLEMKITQCIAEQYQQEKWEIYIQLDDLISKIAEDSDARLGWQTQHSL